MFSLMVQLEVRPEDRDEFLAAITTNAEASVRDEPGCHRFDVSRGRGRRAPLRPLRALRRRRAAFEAHKQAPHFAAWRQVADRVLASQVNTRGTVVASNATRCGA